MATKYSICHLRDTTANWEKSIYIIPEGEMIVEQRPDGSVRIKIGDGKNTFKKLPYVDLGSALSPADVGVFVQNAEPESAPDGSVWIDTSNE